MQIVEKGDHAFKAGILIALVVVIARVSPASADEDPKQIGRTVALCTGEVEETGDPGWWLITPDEVTISGVGTLSCVGTVDGRRLTGQPGPMAYRGSYDGRMAGIRGPLVWDTCLTGSGSGTWEATLPTVDGLAVAYSGPFDFEYVLTHSVVHGALGRFHLEMIWKFYPNPEKWSPDEDCVRKRLRQAVGRGAGALR